jgi:4-hydroxy-3-methylbut-2-enyl diphosphate reductase
MGESIAMRIRLAGHFGMCFGVRDALRKAHEVAARGPVTVLGALAHNPAVTAHLRAVGMREGDLGDLSSAATRDVVITAHGASDRDLRAWRAGGFEVTDTTCPLVRKAHAALAGLVGAGYFPVVIGKKGHVEVRGLIGDHQGAVVVESEDDIAAIPLCGRIGVVSQTTQPSIRVLDFVMQIKSARPDAEVRFVDTVCQPTKDRQAALDELCRESEVVVVVGGRHSNNTHELVATARRLGVIAHHVETPDDLDPAWFDGVEAVGVTAGTSTLDESVHAVVERLRTIAASTGALGRVERSHDEAGGTSRWVTAAPAGF